jgi:hypothetical protein
MSVYLERKQHLDAFVPKKIYIDQDIRMNDIIWKSHLHIKGYVVNKFNTNMAIYKTM